MQDLYKYILEKIPGHGPRSALAKQTLRWLVYTKQPFKTAELESALLHASKVGTPNLKSIVAACQSLVVQRQGRFEFIHTTLKEYLQGDPESQS